MRTSSDSRIADSQVTLPHEVDLHARPAANFVKAAMRFSSKVWIATEEKEADAKSLLAVLALGARRGTSLRLRAEGGDAFEAVETLAATVADLRE